MFKTFSTVTNKFYDTLEEAKAAEAAFVAKSATESVEELRKKISEVKAKQVKEVTAAQTELNDIEKKIADLNARRGRISADMAAINTEATLEINEFTNKIDKLLKQGADNTKHECCCNKKANVENNECSVKVKTFNSDTDKDWKTVIDKTGTFEDVEKELVKILKSSDTSLKDLLTMFNI